MNDWLIRQIVDSAFPTGAFAHSWGLESAWHHGELRDSDALRAFLETSHRSSTCGGDNLAAQFSRELADYTIYVIDVSGGDRIPRKGGPGITQSDLLVINKTDLASS